MADRQVELPAAAAGLSHERPTMGIVGEILAAATDIVFANLTADERRTFHQLTLRALDDTNDVLHRSNDPPLPRATNA